MTRSPCARCGILLHTGEGRVTVSFTADELEELIIDSLKTKLRERLFCALGTIDPERERALRERLS